VFCDQLVATAEVVGAVPADAVGVGHQQIDEVVDHDRDLRSINGLEPDRPIRFGGHDPPTLQEFGAAAASESPPMCYWK